VFQAVKAHLIQFGGDIGRNAGIAVVDIHRQLLAECGLAVTLAIYLTAAALTLMLIWRIVKLSFDIVRCVALPATAVALLGAWLLPFPFLHILPVATAVFAVLLLFRG